MRLSDIILLKKQLLAPIGDGHADVQLDTRQARDAERGIPDRERVEFLPFLVKMIGERPGDPLIAIRTDRTSFIDDDHPVLEAIDGVPIKHWINLVATSVPAGSPAFVRSRACRELRSLWQWREQLNLPERRSVTVTLASPSGESRITRTLRTRSGMPSRGDWPRTATRILDGDIAYLRLATMRASEEELDELRGWMDRFRETRGLIIDVRGNGGGHRHILHLLGEYLVDPAHGPVIYTAVRPRFVDNDGPILSPRLARRMAHRHLYPADHPRWSPAQREAIARFVENFRPVLDPPAEFFAPWHFAMIEPGQDDAYYYDKPIVILIDANCFSATDVFIHAMSLLPNVMLIGQPSAGSSGAPMTWPTPIPGVSLRLSSILSYRADGTRFDDPRSQEPDIRIDPLPTYFIGQSDVVLDEAVRTIIADDR